MPCSTATRCAALIADSYQADLDIGAAEFSAVRADGAVVTVEYDLGSARADFESGRVEDGRTLEQWADEELIADIRDDACDEFGHRDFIDMGGTVIHSYLFSDGEVLREVVIDLCE